MPILELTDVTKTFHTKSFWGKTKEVHAVNGVTFSINKGETLGLVGESAAAKVSSRASSSVSKSRPQGRSFPAGRTSPTRKKRPSVRSEAKCRSFFRIRILPFLPA